jgi:hypothetical protein
MTTSAADTWFQRVMWAGILANVALATPTLLFPVQMLTAAGLPAPEPVMWVRFASLLLILLSLFYVPAAIDLHRARASAWLGVVSRLAGVVFFFAQARDYWLLGVFDFVFLVPLAVLLSLAVSGHAR